ncbi:MAG TPA: DUF1549 domain-containing protein [Planctomycetaceae bacterium]|nr:DUF1549 domain-containing protein [Planctomycetaceae bacterium]
MTKKSQNASQVAQTGKGAAPVVAAVIGHAHVEDPYQVAAKVDEIIQAEMDRSNTAVAPRCNDADFLRRVSLDIAGISPSAADVTLFGLDPDSQKRQKAVERLLGTSSYATNWARYWRDVIFMRATETRPQIVVRSMSAFESWMAEQLRANKPWHEITSALLTATGDVTEDGKTALIAAQRAEPDEVAAETARIFLGIQIQCANCHDHPTDSWKRDQFHGLAAFFPRIEMRPKPDGMMRSFELVSLSEDQAGRGRFFENLQENPEQFIRRLDRNGDHKISREEAGRGPNNGALLKRLFDEGDSNKDGFLTADEIKKISPPQMNQRRGSLEYYMPDLNDPHSKGKLFAPTFFLGNLQPGTGLSDHDRRQHLANYITSPENPWYAKALVNRVWAQLVGEGFYMPVDDIGPERSASHPQALESLSHGFSASGYDLHWLFRAIVGTEAYQRQIRHRDPQQSIPPFAAASPTRLRADQLYDALTRVLGVEDLGPAVRGPGNGMGRNFRGGPRTQFDQKYGFDPSTSPEEVTGTLPQALTLMNWPLINNLIRATGQTQLARILQKFSNDDDVLQELYLLVHAREPSAKELQIAHEYLKEVGNRQEAFEDILWSLLNSTEFQTKR